MALVVNLNGTPIAIRDLAIAAAQGNQDTASLIYRTTNPAAIVIDDVITVEDAGTRMYGCTVKTVEVGPYGDSTTEKSLRLDTVDFNERGTRQIIFGMTIPGGTLLKAAVQMVLEHVERAPGLPTEIHASWTTNGPSIGDDDLEFDDITPDAVFRALELRTSWLGNIEYNEKIWFFAPGSRSAPWNIAPGDGNMFGAARSIKTRDKFYNRIALFFSEHARNAYAFFRTIAGANFIAGAKVQVAGRDYDFVSALTGGDTEVLIGSTLVDSLSNLVDAIMSDGPEDEHGVPTPNGVAVAFMRTDGLSIQVSAFTPGAAGNSIAVAYIGEGDFEFVNEGFGGNTGTLTNGLDEALTNRVIVDDAASQAAVGIYTGKFEAADTFELESATALANLVLANALQLQTGLKYTTRRGGLLAGMTQTIHDPSVGAPFTSAVSCLIVDINTRMTNEGAMLERVVSVVYPGTFYRGSHWRDLYKIWSGEGTGGGISGDSVGGGGTTTIIGSSVYLLQGNDSSWVESSGPTWVPASGNAAGEGGIEYIIDTALRGNSAGVVYVRVRALSGSVQARLYDITSGLQVGIGTAITSTTFVNDSFPVTFTTGAKRYRLELLPSLANVGVGGVGYLQ